MVVDTSAVAAIFFGEADAEVYLDAIASASSVSMSAATLVEASIVSTRDLGTSAISDLNLMVSQNGIRIVPVDETTAQVAVSAWTRFGRGNHPAKLNYGDCFSYALAVTLGEPLLFKGEDFPQTDVRSALSPS